jgi:uncharacterized protein YndB with AHSA1/START domain
MAQASVSDVVVVAAPVEVVWAVITDPALIPEPCPRPAPDTRGSAAPAVKARPR